MDALDLLKHPITSHRLKYVYKNIGMQYQFDWNPTKQTFIPYHDYQFLHADNTVVVFFKRYRIAIRIHENAFSSEMPIFPSTLLENHTQVIYTINKKPVKGCKVIATDLDPQMFCFQDQTILEHLQRIF